MSEREKINQLANNLRCIASVGVSGKELRRVLSCPEVQTAMKVGITKAILLNPEIAKHLR